MKDLDPAAVPLEGTHLIEASAGTGKTHTIVALYTRLLVEQGLKVDEILVVTFTNAATADLRARVRAGLRRALAAFEAAERHEGTGPGGAEGDVIDRLPWRRRAAGRDLGADRRRLTAALRDLDTAAIFTIHGFCQRMLREHAFESGVAFDAVLVEDEAPLRREVVLDYWSRGTYGAPEVFVRHLAARKITPESLLTLVNRVLRNAGVRVVPDEGMSDDIQRDLAPLFDRWRAVHAAAAALWGDQRGGIVSLLADNGGALNGNSYRASTIRASWAPAMDRVMASGAPLDIAGFDAFDRFTPAVLAAKTNKGRTPPAHPFFDACQALLGVEEDLVAALDRHVRSFQRACLAYARRELDVRKARRGQRSFDDLLAAMDRALGAGGALDTPLAEAVRARFKAALIDEFQDTDPLQYAIFHRIFGPRGALFLIGDPKQAIYGFRGADVHTYLRAAGDTAADRRWTLARNWRSDPSLVGAVNALFERAGPVFVEADIRFHPVQARPRARDRLLDRSGEPAAGLELLFVQRDEGAKSIAASGPLPARLAAAAVSRLLHAGLWRAEGDPRRLDGDPCRRQALHPGDIAVLVRRNDGAHAAQAALRAIGIPAVLHSPASVFDTGDAVDLERALAAMASPGDAAAIRAALATPLFGGGARDLLALRDDEAGWVAEARRFQDWHGVWDRQGFMPALHRMLDDAKVPERVLALPDGERRMTNLLHLGELLHAAAVGEGLGPLALLRWLARARQDPEARAAMAGEATQLRLESDARAVRIVTIHRSKGLEFPVVVCPDLWRGDEPRDEDLPMFHDPSAGGRLTLALDASAAPAGGPAWADLAAREARAEGARLLYVALTRAKHRCLVLWGAFSGAEKSALGALLHPGPAADGAAVDAMAWREAAAGHVGRLIQAGDEAWLAELRGLEHAGAIEVAAISAAARGDAWSEPPAEAARLAARPFTGVIDATWRASSFSALAGARTAGARDPAEEPRRDAGRDHDEAVEGGADDGEVPGDRPETVAPGGAGATAPDSPAGARDRVLLWNFPAGAHAGNFAHAMLETIDFAQAAEADGDDRRVTDILRGQLRAHGLDAAAWADVARLALADIVGTPLAAGPGAARLRDVARSDRRHEMEFMFPVPRLLTAPRLAAAFAAGAGPGCPQGYADRLSSLGFAAWRGYLHGYVDLVFRHGGRWYVVDFKSNHLGPTYDHYGPGRLAAAMAHHDYVLQYHIYVVAVHRWLSRRLVDGYDYERDFGGVYYLFLRGMRPDLGAARGVFSDRPPAALVERLSHLFGDPNAVATGGGA